MVYCGGPFFLEQKLACGKRLLIACVHAQLDASRRGKITLNYSRDKNEQVKTRTVVGGWLVGEGEEVPATAM